MGRLFAIVAVAFVALIALSGCGGGSDAAAGKSAEQLLTESAVNTRALRSYRFALTAAVDADLASGSDAGILGTLLGDSLVVDGEGAVAEPGDLTFDLTFDIAGSPVQINITKVGGGLYASVLGQAIKIDLPAGAVQDVDATEIAPTIAGWIANPQIVGTEEIDGVAVIHIRGEVDITSLTDNVGSLIGGFGAGGPTAPGTAAQAKSALKRGVIDVWVGASDLLIHRVTADVMLSGVVDAVPQLTALTLTVSATLSGFDEPVDITAPTGARTLDLNAIAGLVGG